MESVGQAVELARPIEVAVYVLHLWGFTTIQITRLLADPVRREAILGGVMVQVERSLADFLRRLEGMGFEGPVILEVNSKPDLEESLERVGLLY